MTGSLSSPLFVFHTDAPPGRKDPSVFWKPWIPCCFFFVWTWHLPKPVGTLFLEVRVHRSTEVTIPKEVKWQPSEGVGAYGTCTKAVTRSEKVTVALRRELA